jgi:hypothetical protein
MDSYPCDFVPLESRGLKPQNVVFSYLSSQHLSDDLMLRSIITLRSLRSCDSFCRIVLFVEPETEIPIYYQETFQEVGVEMASSFFFPPAEYRIPHMARFECEYMWLRNQFRNFSRVFHCDLFDSFFQISPFNWIPHQKLVFVMEPVNFSECPWNSAWLHNCYGIEGRRIFQNQVVNTGSIGGPAELYLKFLEVLTGSSNWTKCRFPSGDQPIFNWLLWTGKFRENRIQYVFVDCQDGVFTCQYCSRFGYAFGKNGLIVGSNSMPLKFVHQYNRQPEMARHIAELCHVRLDGLGTKLRGKNKSVRLSAYSQKV